MPFVPSGYLSIHEALNRLGRELFPSAWTGEEHKARRGLISEEEWSRIKDLPPPRGGGAGMETPRSNPARKAAPHSSLDPSDPLYQEEYRARQRHVDVQRRLRQLLDAGELEAAILDYLDGHNADPRPFIWTKTPAVILEKERRALDKLESITAGYQESESEH